MTGKWKFFKLVSMLLIASSFYCAFSLSRATELRFWIMLGVVSLVGIAFLALFLQLEKNVLGFVSEMESQLNLTERDSLYKFPAPALIVDGDGVIVWYNKAFSEQIHPEDAYGIPLNRIFDIDLKNSVEKLDTVIDYNSDHFRVRALTTERKDEKSNAAVSKLTLLYFQDVSELNAAKQELEDSRNAVALILIDDYDEMFVKVKDSDKAYISAQIDRTVEDFIEEHNGVLKKISSNRYFAVISEDEIRKLEAEKFESIMNKIHEQKVNDRPVTISIGIGRGCESIRVSEEKALTALNLTQGRGGDQVAVQKNGADCKFFGGNFAGIENNTKVKTRIFSDELKTKLRSCENVIIMGHTQSDFDALGSGVGLAAALRIMGYKAYMYANTNTDDLNSTHAMPMLQRLRENIHEEDEIVIDEQTALERMTEKTLFIMVDTHSVRQLDSAALYEKAADVVVIDHHSTDNNSITNISLKLVDTDASSASEMVTELIQYFNLDSDISNYYADAMLAGIMLDTNGFIMQTRSRTFEAATYLKKLGADTIAVKMLFADPMETNIRRSQLIEYSEIYKNCAISISREVFEDKKSEYEGEIAAVQAADTMLNIQGIKASFVLFMINSGKAVKISARSYGPSNGALNAQRIMEKLGGGGRQTAAAVVKKDVSIDEALVMLKEVIDAYTEQLS